MIGVLALQGGFKAHRDVFEAIGVETREVRLPKHLEGLSGLVLPGGESTTMLKMMGAYNLFEPLQEFGRSGAPILGTCAGAILMCEKVNFKNQQSLGWLPASIDRNAYGSQRESFFTKIDCEPWGLSQVPVMFIRAPRFTDLGEGVKVLSRYEDHITGVTYKNLTAVTYHPEMGEAVDFHRHWYQHHFAGVNP